MSAVESQAPEQLFERVQELQERLERSATRAPGSWPTNWSSALVGMYGVGLERIVSGLMGDEEGSGWPSDWRRIP